MTADHILVIAPDDIDRARTVAALEHGGLPVVVADTLPEHEPASASRRACTIIDGALLPDLRHVAIAMCIRFHPVVLIDDLRRDWLHDWVSAVVGGGEATADIVRAVRSVSPRAA